MQQAIYYIDDGKYTRLDGFTSIFFSFCWEKIKQEFLEIVEDYSITKGLLMTLDTNFLYLVPTENYLYTLGNFYDISLCNVSYKVMKYVLENRTKPLLPQLILLE